MKEAIAAACEIMTTRFGSVRDSEIFQTWGPTLVIGATCDGAGKIVLKASKMQDVRIVARTSRLAASQGVSAPTVLGEGFDDRLPGGHWFAMERVRGMRWQDTDARLGMRAVRGMISSVPPAGLVRTRAVFPLDSAQGRLSTGSG